MIEEWMNKIAIKIGQNFNRAAGLEDSLESNLSTGILCIWLMLILISLLLICLSIIRVLEKRK